MLTKEECFKAMDYMCYCCKDAHYSCDLLCDRYRTFEQLINEYFELKEVIKKHGLENLTNHELDYAIASMIKHVSLAREYEETIIQLKSNPPLKFEEFELGKWYWDNKLKDYILIEDYFGDNCFEFYSSAMNGVRRFEENRFYRRQLEER